LPRLANFLRALGQCVGMKKSTPFRFLAVILTLTMMAGYVVYSRQQPRVTAPDSKFAIMPAPASLSLRSESRTNSLTIEEVYATSSKSGTPLVKVPGFTQPAPVQQGLPSGLKIDASFIAQPPAASLPSSGLTNRSALPVTNRIADLKPAT